MTVTVNFERHLHQPRVYITDPTNIVSLYTLSSLLQSKENIAIYYSSEYESQETDDLIKKICPRAIKEAGVVGKGMERSILFLRPGMTSAQIKAPLEGYHRFVLIVSMIGADDPINFPLLKPLANLESEAKNAGYESYCVLRLPPIYQHLNMLSEQEIESVQHEFVAIDAEDAATAISHILLDPEIHRGEVYTIHSPTHISPHTLKSAHQNLPKFHGSWIQPPENVLEFIKSKKSTGYINQFVKITGFEEMIGFEEFVKKCTESLYHQRFICRI